MKASSICIMGILERGKEIESVFKAIMAENFPNLGREKDIHVQFSPNRLNPNGAKSEHFTIKWQKSKTMNFESSKRKERLHKRELQIRLNKGGPLNRNFSGQKTMG